MIKQSDIEEWHNETFPGVSIERIMLKLTEETGELARTVYRDDLPGIGDAIGDITIVLNVIASRYGLEFNECVDIAWDDTTRKIHP